ncbi:MAG: hypothetical protein P3C09_07245 [Gemmatimonadota bacterium]|nr:hypothetical protein [Gemmatimonadota bacterium]MDQ8167540.1 hypothetical protein [Gemmatimonadota bacterium]
MTAPDSLLRRYDDALRAALPGLLCAVATLLFGYGMGVVFGLNEDLIKSRLSDAAAAVSATVYNGDQAAAKAVLDKSWAYMQRAHLHAGGLGAAALGLTPLVVMLDVRTMWTRLISLGLGAGALGYSVFWLLAGFRAPSLGSTGAAKESLAWLAIPSSGAVVISTVATAALIVMALLRRKTP